MSTSATARHTTAPPPAVTDVLVSLAVLVGGNAPTTRGAELEWRPDVAVLNVVVVGVLLARRRYPRVVLAAVTVLLVAGAPLGLFNSGTVLALAVATFTFSVATERRTSLVVTLTLAGATYALALGQSEGAPQFPLMVCLAGAVGDAIRTQRAVMAAATERADRAERTREAVARQRVAEERLSIARDLHDVVGHQIAVINLHAGVAAGALADRPETADASLAVIRQASRTVLAEISDLLATLRDPSATTPLGLEHLDDVVRAVSADGLVVSVRTEGEPAPVSSAVDVVALRVVQEALTNAHKHGVGHRAHVLLTHAPDELSITVTNQFAPEEAGPGTRYGLIGTAERVESVRGRLTSGPTSPSTWTVHAVLPTTPHEDDRSTS